MFVRVCLCKSSLSIHEHGGTRRADVGRLTRSVALHLNDTFRILARLPGVEGSNSNSDFYRRPGHVCGAGQSPSKMRCVASLLEDEENVLVKYLKA